MNWQEAISEFEGLKPTQADWQMWHDDPLYIWDGKDFNRPLVMCGLSKEDNQFIIFSYRAVPVLVDTVRKAADKVRLQTKQIEELEANNKELIEKVTRFSGRLSRATTLIVKLVAATDMFELDSSSKEATEFLQEKQ